MSSFIRGFGNREYVRNIGNGIKYLWEFNKSQYYLENYF